MIGAAMMKIVLVELDVPDNCTLCRIDFPEKQSVYRGGPRLSFFHEDGELHSCRRPTEDEIVRLEAARSTRAIADAVCTEQERREDIRQREGRALANKTIEDRIAVTKESSTPRFPSPKTTWHLLHHLWSKAVGTPGYDKKQWLALESIVLNRGRMDELSEAAAEILGHRESSGANYELPKHTYPLEWSEKSG